MIRVNQKGIVVIINSSNDLIKCYNANAVNEKRKTKLPGKFVPI